MSLQRSNCPPAELRPANVSRITLLAALLLLVGCATSTGSECGGGQYAQARAFLPDTGINSGDTLSVGFTQHDMKELSELSIWHMWPFGTGAIDPEPDPRVRIVTAGGRVLLDSPGSRYNQPEDRHNRPTWYVFTWIRNASLRNAFFDGFRNETLWIELWHARATQPGTRVRLVTDEVGVHEKAWCV
jgi:hypothetical protein